MSMDNLHRENVEALQRVEDDLLDSGFDEVTIATQNGSWSWQTAVRARVLAQLPEGQEPTAEEYDMAAKLITAAPQDHAKLLELIAIEFARRRLSSARPAR